MESYMTTYRRRNREERDLELIRSLMTNVKCSAEHAMDLLDIPEADRAKYLAQLEEKQGS